MIQNFPEDGVETNREVQKKNILKSREIMSMPTKNDKQYLLKCH